MQKVAGLTLALFISIPLASAQQAGPQPSRDSDLTAMKLEDLMSIHVTSVSKEDQKLSQVAAAIFVIEQDDIRRSGATNFPDLLRMVPGMDVAQINSNTWAISARGFNSQFSNKLLVLVDGRVVYTPLFDEVSWDTVDVPLEDVDRIEVIRGPGGTIWGNNAVNGVINIITKKAQETPGVLIEGGGGTVEQGFGTVQFGGATKGGTAYRIFAKYLNRDHFPDLNGQNGSDASHLLHGGFRADSSLSGRDRLTVQGDIYAGNEGASIVHSILSPPDNITEFTRTGLSGGNVLGRWDRTFSSRSDISLQSFFDRYTRSGPESREVRNTFDFEFRHHLVVASRHDVTWGTGIRYTANQTVGTIDQAFVPTGHSGHLFNFFIEDQITLKADRLFLYAGTKVESNYYTGFDFEPSIRMAWTPNDGHTIWAAVSDTHRAPSERDVSLSATLAALPGPAEAVIVGNPNFADEFVVAYELGYRSQLNTVLSIDVATFLNNYHDLQTIEPLPSFIDPNSSSSLLIIPKSFANKMHGNTGGVETSLHWKVTDRWILSPGYSFLKMHLHTDPTSGDTTSVQDTEGSSPAHQAQLRSQVALPYGLNWDSSVFFVAPLPAQSVPSYTRLDSQLTLHVAEGLQFSITAQNLLQDHHVEFNSSLGIVNPSQVKRGGYAKVTWSFK